MTEKQAITLSVPDVSCQHCIKAIDIALGALPGTEHIITNLQTKTVSLRYDPDQASVQQIEAALDEIGYTVAG